MLNCKKASKAALFTTTGIASLILATPAFAECTPDPAVQGQPVECSGTDSDGIVLTSDTVVNVQAGADVQRVTATSVPPPGAFFPQDVYSFLNVSGTVHSVVVESGQPTAMYPFAGRSFLGITVAEGGVIDHNGVQLRVNTTNAGVPSPGNAASAWIDNSGLITSDSGPALFATDSFYTSFTTITNQQTGTIRGIYAPFSTINNKGTINVAGGEAIVYQAPIFGGFGVIDNSGTISNAGGGFATIDLRLSPSATGFLIRNSGIIENPGAGVAIAAGGPFPSLVNTLYIDNSGTISGLDYGVSVSGNIDVTNTGTITGGSVALYASGAIYLRNYGLINGTVRAEELAPFPFQPAPASSILLARGSRINGDLLLGAGDDVISIEFGGGSLTDLVTGTIDGGGGNNTLRYYFGPGLAEISDPLPPIAGFTFAGVEIDAGADVRFLPGFTLDGPLSVTAIGTNFNFAVPKLTNLATLNTNDTAFIIQPRGSYYASALDFTNAGSITATLPQGDRFAVLVRDGMMTNTGSINAIGGGGILSEAYQGVLNYGSVTADGTGISGSQINNFGSIVSNQGIGAQSNGFLQNSGSIQGGTIGAKVTGQVINTGTIGSSGTGILISGYGSIRNDEGGVINGQGVAIAIDPAFAYYNSYAVQNAGTINGDVNLVTGGIWSAINTYEAVGNGTLNGNLYLGNGRLVTRYGATGPLGGVTGTIFTDPGATLEYNVFQDATLAFPNRPASTPFTNVTWYLIGSKLTLTGPMPADPYMHIEGNGSVDIRTDIATNGLRPLIDGTGLVTNYGTLTITHSDASQDPFEAGPLATWAVTNEGTIIVRELAPSASGLLARGMGLNGTVINNGRILVSGGVGVASNLFGGWGHFENHGTIAQLAGGTAGIGVINTGDTVNYGSITTTGLGVLNTGAFYNTAGGVVRSEGFAIQFGASDGPLSSYGGGMVINEGVIESTKSVAIRGLVPSWTNTSLINEASGTIKGKSGGPAIVIDGGGIGINNRGLIDGDVRIAQGSDPFIPYSYSSFVNEGGTLKGNLTFGAGSDAFVQQSGTVTGTVDGGAGTDQLLLNTNDTVVTGFDLRKFRNFESFSLYGGGQFTVTNAPAFQDVRIAGPKVIVPANQTLVASNSLVLDYGWLQVDGTVVTGNMVQGYNTILSGSGTIDPFAISVQYGFVVPGGDGVLGRLTVKGNLGFDNGGALMIDVGTGDSDRLVLKGDATETGAIYLGSPYAYFPTDLNLRAVGTGPRFGKVYTIITAEGGVSGQFSSVQGTFGVLVPQLTYNPNSVTLTFTANPLAAQLPQGATAVEMSFAQALDGLRGTHYISLSSLYGTVDLLDPHGLGLALGALNPTIAGEASGFYRQQGTQMFDLVANRMSLLGSGQVSAGRIDTIGLSGEVAGLVQAPAASQLAAGQLSLTRSLSGGTMPGIALPRGMSGFVSGGMENRRGSLAGFGSPETGRRSWHMAMGLEFPVGDNAFLGSAVMHSEGLSGRRGMQASVSSSQVATYGAWQLTPRAYLGGLVSFGVSHVGMERQTWVGSSALNLVGSGTSFSFGMQLEGGYRMPLGSWGSLTPHAGLRYSGFGIDNMGEQGSQAALRLSGIGDNRLELRLGLRFDAQAPVGSGWSIAPVGEVEWIRTLAGGQGSMTVQFANADAASFNLPFGTYQGSSIRAKGGLSLRTDRTSVTFAVSSENDWTGERDNRAAVELRFGF